MISYEVKIEIENKALTELQLLFMSTDVESELLVMGLDSGI